MFVLMERKTSSQFTRFPGVFIQTSTVKHLQTSSGGRFIHWSTKTLKHDHWSIIPSSWVSGIWADPVCCFHIKSINIMSHETGSSSFVSVPVSCWTSSFTASTVLVCSAAAPGRQNLDPLPVPAQHGRGRDAGEQPIREQLFVWEAGQELSDADEVHLQQDVLMETQDSQTRPEQELLAVPEEDVPDSARHVQGEGLSVERQDPVHEVEVRGHTCRLEVKEETRKILLEKNLEGPEIPEHLQRDG